MSERRAACRCNPVGAIAGGAVKLIRRVSLGLREGTSDKVYIVITPVRLTDHSTSSRSVTPESPWNLYAIA